MASYGPQPLNRAQEAIMLHIFWGRSSTALPFKKPQVPSYRDYIRPLIEVHWGVQVVGFVRYLHPLAKVQLHV